MSNSNVLPLGESPWKLRFIRDIIWCIIEMKARKFLFGIILFLISLYYLPSPLAASGAFSYFIPKGTGNTDSRAWTVVGSQRDHVIQAKETLLDIARDFDLGFWELKALYRELDAWIPPEGLTLKIPSTWILPKTQHEGIVINVAEMRLYLFIKSIRMVKTYPIGIGVLDGQTPFGTFFVTGKVENPTWHIPPRIRPEYGGRAIIPPGPENPLGTHWISLSRHGYGIHGTDFPWGVGRLVSHGCIRLYPEDIENLYPLVRIGLPVEIIYEPIKFGFRGRRIFVEAHEDIYLKIPDLLRHGFALLEQEGLKERVNLRKFTIALVERRGMPVDITKDEERKRVCR
jgi:L,D-transpeptidase ErfK/SrfK